jgi:tetratricopeptide (TPR) repeat protein
MKNISLLFLASFSCAALVHFQFKAKPADSSSSLENIMLRKKQNLLGCSPDLANMNFIDPVNRIPLLDGWGKHRMKVTVNNDSANIYFQQGINMYYGFHIIEALASFEKATYFEPDFAMAYWGKALAYGPNINDLGYAASPEALEASSKAKELGKSCTPVEKALIEAMMLRYSSDSTLQRQVLNQRYAGAMKKTYAQYPNHADVAALYADALMVQHPWDLYDRHYQPKPWTPEIVRVLEKLIIQFPKHPGASHYYIHAIEGSTHPEKGIAVADRLGSMMPGLSHLVHMPSHIYIRSGNYEKGVQVNDSAVKNYYNYLSRFPVTGNNSFLYLIHNLHMQAACANMDGQFSRAMKYSKATEASVDSSWPDAGGFFGMYAQYLTMTPYYTLLRFGKWDEILKLPEIPESRVYASIMSHFARGVAYARQQKTDLAETELEKIQSLKGHSQLMESPAAFNPGIAAVNVAENLLAGILAEEKNQFTEAVALLEKAVDLEDGMLYNEPKDWLIPARQFLGRALLKSGRYAEAEKVYRKDLTINPANGWSLTGLEKALAGQNKIRESKAIAQLKLKAFKRADEKIGQSVF